MVARASTARVVGCDGEHEHGVKEMAAKLRVVLVGSEKAGSGENGCGGELCSAINGGRERGRGERQGERAVGARSVWEWLSVHKTRGGGKARGRRWGRSARMAATPWPRVGILTSRWRARSSASWKPFLGWFGWEFDGGPLTKFDLHPMLYKFR